MQEYLVEIQIVDGLKTGFRNLPKVEKLNY